MGLTVDVGVDVALAVGATVDTTLGDTLGDDATGVHAVTATSRKMKKLFIWAAKLNLELEPFARHEHLEVR